ncbi:MAG: TraB/GumN family protein [bacterium]|nr:TraB/GumN family protein [bacterium]
MFARKFFSAILVTFICLWAISPGTLRAADEGKSFLWELDTGAGKSYLLGSVHMLQERHYPLKKVIRDAFNQSDILLVEADITGEKAVSGALIAMKKGVYSGKETLKTNISDKTYELAKKKLKELGMDIEGMNSFKPWMVSTMIIMAEMSKLGFNPKYGIDMHFMNKAVAQQKKIMELEGAEFQFNLLDSFSKKENEKFLLSAIVESGDVKKEFNNLIAAWQCGDTTTMESLLVKSFSQYPELLSFKNKLLDERNERMVDKLMDCFKTGKNFLVIVGAAHMVGEKGLIQLLKKKGYSLKQL